MTIRQQARVAQGTLIMALSWGAFAFGAVYPWAYWPLAIACLVIGGAGLLLEPGSASGASRALMWSLAAFACLALLQVVPVSNGALARLSPAAPGVIVQMNPAFGAGLLPAHPISIQPSLTWTSIVLFVSLAMLAIGSARIFSLIGAFGFVTALTVTGVALALTGIIQKAVYNGKIYGFWVTQTGGSHFGPFVNRNHFAGWMLLALPLTIGLVCAYFSRAFRGVRPTWRDRLLWLSSPHANQLILLMAAVLVMALALVLAMSRSGMGALVVALAVTAWFVVRGARTVTFRTGMVIYMALLLLVVVGCVGPDVIAARFIPAPGEEFAGRIGPWTDAWRLASRFPLVGAGLNTYGVAMLFFQTHALNVHFSQAHNDYLQLLAEGGLLLALPALAIGVFLVRDVRHRFVEDEGTSAYWIRAGAVASLIAIALQETVDFSLQIPGNAALFAVVCGIALHKAPAGRRTPRTH
jgi:O-antigen ligase